MIDNDHFGKWYSHTNYQKEFLIPSAQKDYVFEQQDLTAGTWKRFHLMNFEFELPARDPSVFVRPLVKYRKKGSRTDFGLEFYTPDGDVLLRLLFLPAKVFDLHLNKQPLFKLPLISQHLKKINKKQVWKDLFIKEVGPWKINFSQMVYSLYLLHLRQIYFPKTIQSFSSVKERAFSLVELESQKNNYTSNLFMFYEKGLIHSFIMTVKKGNERADRVQQKILKEVSLHQSSPQLASFYYKEFKTLTYQSQVDQEGALLLLSSWTHDMEQVLFIKEMIQNLEKGESNKEVLGDLYNYAFARFGKTFSHRKIDGVKLPAQVLFQRNIELENIKNEREVEREIKFKNEVELSDDDVVDDLLKRAKKDVRRNGNKMTID